MKVKASAKKEKTEPGRGPTTDFTDSTDGKGKRNGELEMELKEVAVKLIQADPNQPRREFDAVKLQELADSIAEAGLLQPPVVELKRGLEVVGPDLVETDWRVVEKGTGKLMAREPQENIAHMTMNALGGPEDFYQLVAGERRWRAVQLLGWKTMPVLVRGHVDDENRFRMQMVENLQRENITALEEALAYQRQVEAGKKPEAIAKELGVSRATVFGRLVLTRLHGPVREALVAGRISTSVAGLVAMVPEPKRQEELLKEVQGTDAEEPRSFREVQNIIEREYCRQLKEASFDVGKAYQGKWNADAEELSELAPCEQCRYRSGNMLDEFPELAKRPNVCTKVSCFLTKTRAHGDAMVVEALQNGQKVMTAKETKEIFSRWNDHELNYGSGYVEITQPCEPLGYDCKRSWKTVLGKDCPLPIVAIDPSGRARELLKLDMAMTALKDTGNKVQVRESGSGGMSDAEKAKVARKKFLMKIATRAAELALPKLSGKMEQVWPMLAQAAFKHTSIDVHTFVAKRRGLAAKQTEARDALKKFLDGTTDEKECREFVIECLLLSDLGLDWDYHKFGTEYKAVCALGGVNLQEVAEAEKSGVAIKAPKEKEAPTDVHQWKKTDLVSGFKTKYKCETCGEGRTNGGDLAAENESEGVQGPEGEGRTQKRKEGEEVTGRGR